MKKGEPQTLAVHAFGAKLLAIQPEGEAWQPLAVPADGEVSATIPGGPFTVVSVCDEPDLFDYYVVFGGTGLKALDVYCSTPPSTVKVSLSADFKGRAAIGTYPLLGGISWDIPPGTYDITAYDDTLSPPRFEIRRGVSVTADTQLTFDLGTTGKPLEEIGVVTDALESESVVKSSRLYTAGGARMSIRSTASNAHVWRVPAGELQTGDRQTITAVASKGAASRTSTRAIPNTSISIVMKLPPALTSASAAFGPPQSTTWAGAAELDEAYFSATNEDFTVMYDAYVTPDYVKETGTLTSIELPVPSSVPGWNPAWKLPPADGLDWSLAVTNDLEGLNRDSVGWQGKLSR